MILRLFQMNFFVIYFLSMLLVPTFASNQQQSQWLTYDNSLLGVKMKYPANWTYEENEPSEQTTSIGYGFRTNFIPISMLDKDTFDHYIRFSISELNIPYKNLDIDTIKDYYVKHYLSSANGTLPSWTSIEASGKVYLDNKSSYRFGVKDTITDSNQLIFIVKNDDKYLQLEYDASPEYYSKYLPVIQNMTNSTTFS